MYGHKLLYDIAVLVLPWSLKKDIIIPCPHPLPSLPSIKRKWHLKVTQIITSRISCMNTIHQSIHQAVRGLHNITLYTAPREIVRGGREEGEEGREWSSVCQGLSLYSSHCFPRISHHSLIVFQWYLFIWNNLIIMFLCFWNTPVKSECNMQKMLQIFLHIDQLPGKKIRELGFGCVLIQHISAVSTITTLTDQNNPWTFSKLILYQKFQL